MDNAGEVGNGWSAITLGIGVTWEWVERLFTAIWTGLQWPHAVLIMFCVGIFYFRSELKGVIPRIRRIGADGFEVEPQNIPRQPPVPQVGPNLTLTAEFPHAHSVALSVIKKQFDESADSDMTDLIMNDDASWRVLWFFENVYSYIFGGQIRLLDMLNQREGLGWPLDDVQREWAAHKEANSPHLDALDLNQYLEFLVSRDLILKTDINLKISATGREFLIWMTKFGRSPNRPL